MRLTGGTTEEVTVFVLRVCDIRQLIQDSVEFIRDGFDFSFVRRLRCLQRNATRADEKRVCVLQLHFRLR